MSSVLNHHTICHPNSQVFGTFTSLLPHAPTEIGLSRHMGEIHFQFCFQMVSPFLPFPPISLFVLNTKEDQGNLKNDAVGASAFKNRHKPGGSSAHL